LDSQTSGKNCITDDDFILLNQDDLVSHELSTQPDCKFREFQADIDTVTSDHHYFSADAAGCQLEDSDASSPIKNSHCVSQTAESALTEHLVNSQPDETENDEMLDIECLMESDEQFTATEESLVSYLAGYVARKSAVCPDCQSVLTVPEQEYSYNCRPIDLFASFKRYIGSSAVGLVSPCRDLFKAVHVIEQQFRLKFSDNMLKPNLAQWLYEQIHPQCDYTFLFLQHPEHSLLLSEKLTRLYITMRVFYAVKFLNRELSIKPSKQPSGSVRRSENARKMQKIVHA
jgi:hypothetical protein